MYQNFMNEHKEEVENIAKEVVEKITEKLITTDEETIKVTALLLEGMLMKQIQFHLAKKTFTTIASIKQVQQKESS